MLLTGESEDVVKCVKIKVAKPGQAEKLTADNMVFSSCNVKEGSGTGVVVATGMQTKVGKIAKLLNSSEAPEESCLPNTKKNQTPMQANLEKLAVTIGYLAVGTCVIVFFIGFGIGTTDPEDPETPSWLFMILIAVTLTVAAIPEGLPLCVTIALSSGCSSLTKENVLVRKIAAVETLGSASVICTDKTGTLTEGKMTLVKMFVSGQDFIVTGKGFDPTGDVFSSPDNILANSHQVVRSTLSSAVLCCNTTNILEKDPQKPDQPAKWKPHGNSSEAPLVVAAQKIGIELTDLEKSQ
jgi:P-type E1-E2 ATPase